jgi:nucleoside-diphosphate-sugar epimerase
MSRIEGKSLLVTGPAGQIAFPLAAKLARDNEVFGIARFSDAATRQRCEEAGIKTSVVDLADPDWSELPERVDHILHLAAIIEPGLDYDRSIRINAEGTGRVMSRFRDAESCLVMSTSGRRRRVRSTGRDAAALCADLLCLEDRPGGGGALRV